MSSPIKLLEKTHVEINEKEAASRDKNISKMDFFLDNRVHVILDITCKQWKKVAVPTGVAIGAGAVIGGATGFVLAGPPGIVPGAAAGVAIVGGLTAITSIVVVCVKIPFIVTINPKYHEWRIKKQRENILSIFDDQVKDHDVLADLRCRISGDFPLIPMRAPCGHIYDKDHIERHLDSQFSAKSSCSMIAGIRFSKAQLVFHPEHLTNIIRACIQVRTVLSSSDEGSEKRTKVERRLLLEGLDHVYADSMKLSSESLSIQSIHIARSALENDVGDDEFSKLMKDVYKKHKINRAEDSKEVERKYKSASPAPDVT